MRVISGTFGGRSISMNDKLLVRPTSDKARGAVFSSLAPYIAGARFLDVCAGTGAMGIEALSRGALKVTAIEASAEVARLIRKNQQALGISNDQLEIKLGRFSKELPALAGELFDIIFADPPYGQGYPAQIIELIANCALLAPGGHLVIEHFSKERVPTKQGTLCLVKVKKYGQTQLSYYRDGSKRVQSEVLR